MGKLEALREALASKISRRREEWRFWSRAFGIAALAAFLLYAETYVVIEVGFHLPAMLLIAGVISISGLIGVFGMEWLLGRMWRRRR